MPLATASRYSRVTRIGWKAWPSAVMARPSCQALGTRPLGALLDRAYAIAYFCRKPCAEVEFKTTDWFVEGYLADLLSFVGVGRGIGRSGWLTLGHQVCSHGSCMEVDHTEHSLPDHATLLASCSCIFPACELTKHKQLSSFGSIQTCPTWSHPAGYGTSHWASAFLHSRIRCCCNAS